MAGWSLWVVGGWVLEATHGVGGYSTSPRNAWALLNGNCAGNTILIGEGSGNCLWDAPEFSRRQRRKLQGLAHGSCWPGAEEPGSKHDLEGKGVTGEMARSGFSYGNGKTHATGCESSPRTHLFVALTHSAVEESSMTP